jgi:hypothetical protein
VAYFFSRRPENIDLFTEKRVLDRDPKIGRLSGGSNGMDMRF